MLRREHINPAARRVTRIGVDVTFLRMDSPPACPPPAFPTGVSVHRVEEPTVALYREIYAAVGAPYCWWLRRIMSDRELHGVMAQQGWSMHLLMRDGQPAGFFELEMRGRMVNLSYFGLMPKAVGQRLGRAFLGSAIEQAWSTGPQALLVNTCTADHPRALGLYESSGFRILRRVRELWDIPEWLGLQIPGHLRI